MKLYIELYLSRQQFNDHCIVIDEDHTKINGTVYQSFIDEDYWHDFSKKITNNIAVFIFYDMTPDDELEIKYQKRKTFTVYGVHSDDGDITEAEPSIKEFSDLKFHYEMDLNEDQNKRTLKEINWEIGK